MNLIPILQTAISPAILISGVGLLLLTMTNRLGRTIDRARELTDPKQLAILWKRARLIRIAIILASSSALTAALLIITIFSAEILAVDASVFIAALFAACLFLMVSALVMFIREVNESLEALRLELKQPPSL